MKSKNTKRRRIAALVLASSMAYAAFVGGLADTQHFKDVPKEHWAYTYINEMAEGGLIAGYGGGIFGPNDPFNVDQMATIICSAKGYPKENKNGYWAYGAVDYCINTLKCLPNMGEINATNYAVPCTRELAYYMLMNGLGKGPDATATANPQLEADKIPDFTSIDVRYQSAILKAYQQGLTVGTNDKLEFAPKATLTRCQAATMFVRAGWKTAATVATPVTEGRTIDEIYASLKGNGKWEEIDGLMGKCLQYKDNTAGTIEIDIRETMSGRNLVLTMYERSPIGEGLIDNSAYKYAGRRVVKSVLDEFFPTACQDAYMALKDVMLQNIYEDGGTQYPSALRWYDGRMFRCASNSDSHSIIFIIGELNDQNIYNLYKAEVRTNPTLNYVSYAGGKMNDPVAFELDKW